MDQKKNGEGRPSSFRSFRGFDRSVIAAAIGSPIGPTKSSAIDEGAVVSRSRSSILVRNVFRLPRFGDEAFGCIGDSRSAIGDGLRRLLTDLLPESAIA